MEINCSGLLAHAGSSTSSILRLSTADSERSEEEDEFLGERAEGTRSEEEWGMGEKRGRGGRGVRGREEGVFLLSFSKMKLVVIFEEICIVKELRDEFLDVLGEGVGVFPRDGYGEEKTISMIKATVLKVKVERCEWLQAN